LIKSFKHNGLSALFYTGSARKVQAKHAARLNLIPTMLNAATRAGQMNSPGLRLHPLRGRPAGRYAVWVDENFRVTFRFDAADAVEVDYGDYH
jgi:proteic killer suppression protein